MRDIRGLKTLHVYNYVGRTHPHPQHSGWHMWAHISAHLTLQLKDFSLVLLLQVMGSDLQVDQLLGDLWVARVVPVEPYCGHPPFCQLPPSHSPAAAAPHSALHMREALS